MPSTTPPEPIAPVLVPAPSGRWKVGVRLLVSVVVLAILVKKTPHLGGVIPHHNHLHTALLLTAALLLIFGGIVLQAWRWQQVLDAFDHHVGIVRLTTYTLAGQFVGNVLPSTIGGDVVRISRVGAVIDSTETAFASVAIERLTGFIALPALVIVGFAVHPSLFHTAHAPIALLIALATVGALGLILAAAGHRRIAGRFAENQSWTRFIGAVHVGVDRLRRVPSRALGVVGTSLAYQVSVIVAVLCIVRTLELPVPTAAVIAFVPAVAMAQAVPISIGGLGVREGMLVLFLHPFGVRNAQAIAVGLLWYAGVLIASMVGTPAFAVGKRRPAVAGQRVLMATSTEADEPLPRPKRSGRRLSDGSVIYWWLEIVMILLFYFVYSAIRNANKSDPAEALHNARTIISWEHHLGIFHEATLERWALHAKALIIACNYYYGALHFVVTIGVAIVLFRKWSDDYPRWRNTLGVSTGLALIGFISYPLMPPRLLGQYGLTHFHFVDTLDRYPTLWSFDSGAVSKISNQFAAMPSVHCCWALWCACVLVSHLRRPVARAAAAMYPVFTVAVIVLTANHYFLDAVGGFIILGIGYSVAQLATRAGNGGAWRRTRVRIPERAPA